MVKGQPSTGNRGESLVRRTTRDGNVVWVPAVTRESASRNSVDRLLDRVFDGSARQLVAHLLSGGRLSDSDREEIEEMLRADAARKNGEPNTNPERP